MEIPFFKKIKLPTFSFGFLANKPARVVGIDIGVYSTKVVQLRYQDEKAILETYGELLSEKYLTGGAGGSGFLHFLDSDIADLLKDVLRESNVTSQDAVLSISSSSSFVTLISLPKISKKELEQTVPFEARKYVPIPMSEVVLDWEIFEPDEERETTEALLVAVPKEVVEKFKRIAGIAGLNLRALEVETFSLVRSLVGLDPTPTAVINLGYLNSVLAIVDKSRLRLSHNISHGSLEITRALERGMNINKDRAEVIKKDIGLSPRPEEKEIASIISPFVEVLFAEVERMIALYNRKAPRKVQKIILSGGGSSLRGLVDYASIRMGMEVNRGNPFARIVAPAFMQPLLRELGPNFSIAVGLALHEITNR